jgi:chorismate--pyruvate lyase
MSYALLTDLFPFDCEADWHRYDAVHDAGLSLQLRDWLLDPGSLTQRLQSQYKKFQVQVIGEEVMPANSDELALLDLSQGECFIREVVLECDGHASVFARTVIPQSTLSGPGRKLTSLGSKPLGAALFADPRMRRDVSQLAQFNEDSDMARLCRALQLNFRYPIWGRRSLFRLEESPLLVTEVFLPDSAPYQTAATEDVL